jgi:hypothetical protein
MKCTKDSKKEEWIIDDGKEHEWRLIKTEVVNYTQCIRCGAKKAKV